MKLKKRYFIFLLLTVVALLLFFFQENLLAILPMQFPRLTIDEIYLIVEITVAILLVPPAIDILYTRFFIKPKLEVENCRIEFYNVGSQSEFKAAYFDVHNIGKRSIANGKVKVRVKGLWDDFKTVNYSFPREAQPFSLDPDDKLRVKLCELRKGSKATVIHTIAEFPVLELGQIYSLDIRFAGKNFADKKTWKLRLDLLSYENFSLTFEP